MNDPSRGQKLDGRYLSVPRGSDGSKVICDEPLGGGMMHQHTRRGEHRVQITLNAVLRLFLSVVLVSAFTNTFYNDNNARHSSIIGSRKLL